MINTQYINLNMIPSGVLPVLHCSQYDVGRPLGVVVYNGSEAVDVSQYTATIEATRTDGTAILTTVTASGTFATTATMTNKADRYFAQLVLVQNGQRVASLPFVMCVVPAAMDENSEAIQEDASLFEQFSTTMQSSLASVVSESAANSARIDNLIALQTEGSMQGSKITTFVAQSAAQFTSSGDWQSFSFCDYSLHYNTTPSMSVLDGLLNPVLLSAGAYVLASQSASITDEPVYVNLTDDVRFYNHGYLGAAPDKRAVEINMPKVTDAAGNLSGMWLLFTFSVVSDVPVDLSEITDARVGSDGVTYNTLGSAIRTQDAALREGLSVVDSMLSDDATLLSDALTDRSSTSSGITFTLTGNTQTVVGTATANTVGVWIGGTTTAPPSWLTRGKYFAVKITNSQPGACSVWFQGRSTNESTMRILAEYSVSGVYFFNLPVDIAYFRIVTSVSKDAVVNASITIEISNAIDVNTLLALSSDVPTIPNGTDVDTLTSAGTFKITSNTNAATMTNLPVRVAGKLIVMEKSQATRLTQIYVDVSDDSAIWWRSYNASGWSVWNAVATLASVNNIYAHLTELEKRVIIQYASGTWGDATERLEAFIPLETGYMLYRMYRFINAGTNCDNWQVHHAYYAGDNFGVLEDLTVSGEWECAIHLADRPDFSGGHTHGDEVLTGATFLVDGKPTDISTITTKTACRELRIIQTSDMYDPNDNTTKIAEHGKEYVYDKNGLTINQSLAWVASVPLTNCFMAMFLPSKNYIDRAAANSDFKTCVLPSATGQPLTTIVKDKANAVDMWDTASGFSANVSVPVYPTGLAGGDSVSISDNGRNDYNKLYFKVCGSGETTVGELWKSTTIYDLKYKA